MKKKKKTRFQLWWSLNTSETLLLWLIKTSQLEIRSLTWQWIKIGSLTFFMNNFSFESKQGIWHLVPFFFGAKKNETVPRISTVSCLWIGISDKILFPSYYTPGVRFARKTPDPSKDFHFTHCSQGGWAKYPSASKSIKLVFGCHLILHQCFSVFQTYQFRIYPC